VHAIGASIHVTAVQWLAVGVFGFLAALATRGLPALWRHDTDGWDRMPERWVRGLPVAVVTGWAMLAGALLTVLAVGRSGTLGDVATGALGAVLGFVVLAGTTWVSVVLFGRPRFAIPPHLRPGRRRPAR